MSLDVIQTPAASYIAAETSGLEFAVDEDGGTGFAAGIVDAANSSFVPWLRISGEGVVIPFLMNMPNDPALDPEDRIEWLQPSANVTRDDAGTVELTVFVYNLVTGEITLAPSSRPADHTPSDSVGYGVYGAHEERLADGTRFQDVDWSTHRPGILVRSRMSNVSGTFGLCDLRSLRLRSRHRRPPGVALSRVYERPAPVLSDSLIWYDADRSTGTQLANAGSSENTPPAVGGDPIAVPYWTFDGSRSGARLNVNNYSELNDLDIDSGAEATIFISFRMDGAAGFYERLIDTKVGNSSGAYGLRIIFGTDGDNNPLEFRLGDGTNQDTLQLTGAPHAAGVDHTITAQVTTTQIRARLDGGAWQFIPRTVGKVTTPAKRLSVGATNTTAPVDWEYCFKGRIQTVAWWDHKISDAECNNIEADAWTDNAEDAAFADALLHYDIRYQAATANNIRNVGTKGGTWDIQSSEMPGVSTGVDETDPEVPPPIDPGDGDPDTVDGTGDGYTRGYWSIGDARYLSNGLSLLDDQMDFTVGVAGTGLTVAMTFVDESFESAPGDACTWWDTGAFLGLVNGISLRRRTEDDGATFTLYNRLALGGSWINTDLATIAPGAMTTAIIQFTADQRMLVSLNGGAFEFVRPVTEAFNLGTFLPDNLILGNDAVPPSDYAQCDGRIYGFATWRRELTDNEAAEVDREFRRPHMRLGPVFDDATIVHDADTMDTDEGTRIPNLRTSPNNPDGDLDALTGSWSTGAEPTFHTIGGFPAFRLFGTEHFTVEDLGAADLFDFDNDESTIVVACSINQRQYSQFKYLFSLRNSAATVTSSTTPTFAVGAYYTGQADGLALVITDGSTRTFYTLTGGAHPVGEVFVVMLKLAADGNVYVRTSYGPDSWQTITPTQSPTASFSNGMSIGKMHLATNSNGEKWEGRIYGLSILDSAIDDDDVSAVINYYADRAISSRSSTPLIGWKTTAQTPHSEAPAEQQAWQVRVWRESADPYTDPAYADSGRQSGQFASRWLNRIPLDPNEGYHMAVRVWMSDRPEDASEWTRGRLYVRGGSTPAGANIAISEQETGIVAELDANTPGQLFYAEIAEENTDTESRDWRPIIAPNTPADFSTHQDGVLDSVLATDYLAPLGDATNFLVRAKFGTSIADEEVLYSPWLYSSPQAGPPASYGYLLRDTETDSFVTLTAVQTHSIETPHPTGISTAAGARTAFLTDDGVKARTHVLAVILENEADAQAVEALLLRGLGTGLSPETRFNVFPEFGRYGAGAIVLATPYGHCEFVGPVGDFTWSMVQAAHRPGQDRPDLPVAVIASTTLRLAEVSRSLADWGQLRLWDPNL